MSSSTMLPSSQACLPGAVVPDGVRELTGEEIMLVSGAFSFEELYGSAFAGAIAGGIGGLAAGGFAGAGPGALAGAVTGSVGYLAFEAWIYCFG